MPNLNKEYIISLIKGALISLFFTTPFIFTYVNLLFIGNRVLSSINLYLIINIFFNIFSCIKIDLSNEENKLKAKIINVTVTLITTAVILIIFNI
ncbi:MAG: hypothetical protein R3Y05_04040 [bacterium]